MKRRNLLAGAAAALATPRIVRAQGASTLKFVPQADLSLLDPIQSTSFVTRNHALLVFDTLYGVDENWKAQPQMVDGHVTDEDGRDWTLTLRDGLTFHDGTPVLARDVVASLQRWARRDIVRNCTDGGHRRVVRLHGQNHPLPAEEAIPPAAGRAAARPARTPR